MDGAQGHMNEDTVHPIVRKIVLELQTQMFIENPCLSDAYYYVYQFLTRIRQMVLKDI